MPLLFSQPRDLIPTGRDGQLPTNGFVSLKIYDVLGKEVATLVNEHKEAGYYEASFDATHLSSGVYFYKLVAGNFVMTKKMLLAR
jgi:hypothetical protein